MNPHFPSTWSTTPATEGNYYTPTWQLHIPPFPTSQDKGFTPDGQIEYIAVMGPTLAK